MKTNTGVAWIAWFLAALYYFYQHALRSAPAVMMPQLSEPLGLSTVGVASLIGLFYHGYGPLALYSVARAVALTLVLKETGPPQRLSRVAARAA